MKTQRAEAWANARAVATDRHAMAAMLNTSPESVSKLLSYYGLPRFPPPFRYPPEQVSEIVRKFSDGMTTRALATECGMTVGQIAGILDRAGAFKHSRPKITRPKKERETRKRIVRNFGTRITSSVEFAPEPFECRAADVVPLNVSLFDLRRDQCRQPYGDDPREMTYCGHPAYGTLPYCLAHCRVNYQPPQARNRNPRPR